MGKVVTQLEDYRVNVQYDGPLILATGGSRQETHWKNRTMQWSVLLRRLSESRETYETHAEFMSYTKARQDQIKDIGGFVGGHLTGGVRRTGHVRARQVVTLDIDFPLKDMWERLEDLRLNCAMCVYSTHKHTPDRPRLRLIIPLNREVSADEYEAIGRKIAEHAGIEYFDDSTFQPTRLMFWPSHSKDVQPFFEYVDAPFLNADDVLAEYPDWSDVSYWAYSGRVQSAQRKRADKQTDPRGKRGIVGAFCRAYSIPEAIEAFLSEVYEPTLDANRYTYRAGSTSSGLVIYDGETFAYSNHSTDPAGGQLCNAFDLVRVHLFGELDEESDKTGAKAPSFAAMLDFAAKDVKMQELLHREREEEAQNDFNEDDDAWKTRLTVNKKGETEKSLRNAELILFHDPALKGIRLNELSGMIEVSGELPWRREGKFWKDADGAQLYSYMAGTYGVEFPDGTFQKALTKITADRGFNPLRDYLEGLPVWDGVERAETLLIDYLGADDTPYVRAATRKTLVGAVKRAVEPGCKFDTVLVLDGAPGIGKSTLLARLGGEWFSDSLNLTDIRDKTGAEKLQGVWIMEVSELQGMRKADIDGMKGFISRQVDRYRAAYARVTENRPRTAIICGTTNTQSGFLRDTTGNRRFWPVKTPGGGRLSVFDITEAVRGQIWAEAKALMELGEPCYMEDPALEAMAQAAQREALERDERQGEVEDYLNTPIPVDWYEMDISARVDYFHGPKEPRRDGMELMERRRVCTMEIFCECFGKPKSSWRKQDGYDIAGIMARIIGWGNTGRDARVEGYGHQRIFEKIT